MAALPPDATEYILSELTRRLNEVASRLEVGLGRMDGVYVRKDVYDQAMATARQEHDNMRTMLKAEVLALQVSDKANQDDITKLEESRQWLFRLCVGALISAFFSVVVAAIVVVTGLK